MKECNDIIESLMRYHGVDPFSHPHITEEPPTPQKRKRKSKGKGKRVKETVENDPNDNSVVENLENEYSEEVSPPEKRRKESMKS